jgi:RNase P/RNase MRP subunit p29
MIDIAVGNSSFKRVPKKSVTLELSIPNNGKVRIDGTEIVGRPENRIKMKTRKIIR